MMMMMNDTVKTHLKFWRMIHKRLGSVTRLLTDSEVRGETRKWKRAVRRDVASMINESLIKWSEADATGIPNQTWPRRAAVNQRAEWSYEWCDFERKIYETIGGMMWDWEHPRYLGRRGILYWRWRKSGSWVWRRSCKLAMVRALISPESTLIRYVYGVYDVESIHLWCLHLSHEWVS